MKNVINLNNQLKYNKDINIRNIIAAICFQEFKLLRNYVSNHIEDELLDRMMFLSKKEMNNEKPFDLSLNKICYDCV